MAHDAEAIGKLETPIAGHFHAFRRGDGIPRGMNFSPGLFGRLFPNLEPHRGAAADLKELGTAMIESASLVTETKLDNPDLPAGYTYLGQFVDHDITFDPTPLPEIRIDPLGLRNFRTPKLDLDSVYGTGPAGQPYLFTRSAPGITPLFLIGQTGQAEDQDGKVLASSANDLPRNAEARALIGDPRNDENLIVAQLHLAFLKLHNRVAQLRSDLDFEGVRRIVTWHYQWVVLHDFLKRLVDERVYGAVLRRGRSVYRFALEPFMPVEFSGAAYRLHTMIRDSYDFNRVFGPADGRLAAASLETLRNFTGLLDDPINGNLIQRLGGKLPANWVIDWTRFFPFGGGDKVANPSRALDPKLSHHLGVLPVPGATINLAEINLLRGERLGLPSGQNVARAVRLEPKDILRPEEIAGAGVDGNVAELKGFHVSSPLWYYVMKEAELKGRSKRLGMVGSILLMEVFVGLLEGDPASFLSSSPQWTPELPSRVPGKFDMVDLLSFAFGDDPSINGP